VGFACFAAGLMWPNDVALGFGALLAGGVAWSRLVLQRHVPRDLWVGAAVGGLAALVVHGVLPRLQ
jgi:membrane-associated phospholipid phosphatase